MADAISNDNDVSPGGSDQGPDAHGQAAMLLVESLIHGLIAKSVISSGEAIEIVDVAVDVKKEIAGELGDSPQTLQKSLAILSAIRVSLEHDSALVLPSPPQP